jgi:hypothetical protein
MPQRFESKVFSPDANRLMKEAFEAAWLKATLIDGNWEMMRRLLASAIRSTPALKIVIRSYPLR